MKSLYVLCVAYLWMATATFAQVGINTDNSAPDPTAMLDVKSTAKGMLPPRMTTSQRSAITSPAVGLTIFNTDLKCLEFYRGTTEGWHCPCLSIAGLLCNSITVNGYYEAGVALDATNTITVTVNAATAGGYSISTELVNGCRFSRTGTFTASGIHNVTLMGSGTPVSGGEYTCAILMSNSGTTCSTDILFAWPTQNVTIGNGTTAVQYPFYTMYMDSRTQMLYNHSEFPYNAGDSGVITAIGFNVSTFNTILMNGFKISMKNSALGDLSGVWQSGMTEVYSGTYSVPGAGWQMINLQTPFTWNGSNIIVEICYDNMIYALNSTVFGTSLAGKTQHHHFDGTTLSGCNATSTGSQNIRPDIRFELTPLHMSCGTSFTINHSMGNVAPVNKTVTYGTVAGIPGEPAKCWITRNLGASQQATAVNDATEASAGWYWQSNRKKGYKHDGSTVTPAWTITFINENSDWLTSEDPCNLELGTAWRLPTYTEWYNVDNTGGWANWNGAWGSGLKLHAAGYLTNSNGSLCYRGAYGYYWSSTQGGSYFGWLLGFCSSYCNMNNDYNKAYGFSARCLRDN